MRLAKCYSCKYEFYITTELKKDWANNKSICPKCKILYSTLPKTERELMILQDEYYKNNKDIKIFNQIILILQNSPLIKSLSNFDEKISNVIW
jgi:hypothetical protein